MYIVAIAWLYVTLLMALTEGSIVAGIATFLFYGLLPLALLLWLVGTPARRRNRRRREAEAAARNESAIDPDQRSHSPARDATTIRPEALAVGEGAASPPGDRIDPGR